MKGNIIYLRCDGLTIHHGNERFSGGVREASSIREERNEWAQTHRREGWRAPDPGQ